MKKFSFLLLDANVVICLFELGLWDRVVDACDIHLARSVVREAEFFFTGDQRQEIRLGPHEAAGKIQVFDVPASDLERFKERFDPSYAERLDPGETESLLHVLGTGDAALLCSADLIVFRVLTALGCGELGISLEEVLQKLGLGRNLPRQYTRKIREEASAAGFVDRIQERGPKQ